MLSLDKLEQHARKATQTNAWHSERCVCNNCAFRKVACSPATVLALIAVIKAGVAMREQTWHETAGPLFDASATFDAAMSALDAERAP